jgi:hypothetical protein
MAGIDMTKPTNRKRLNKLTILLLAPITGIVFIAGWSLYCIGNSWHKNIKQQQKPANKTPTRQAEVEFFMIPQEQQILIN